MQLSVDSLESSRLLRFEEIFVMFSWILSDEILMDFTICLLACLVLSQLRDLWTFSLKPLLCSEVAGGSSYLKLLTLSLLCLAG